LYSSSSLGSCEYPEYPEEKFLAKLGLGLKTGLRTGSAKGFTFSVSGARLKRLVTLLFLECAGLTLVCFGAVRVLGDTAPSRKGDLDLLFEESLTSLVLLNRTLLFFCGGCPPALVGLLGVALESALGSSDESSMYLAS
jgi:hypothetical protein